MQIKLHTTLVLPGLTVPAGASTIDEKFRAQVERFAAQNPLLATVLDKAPTGAPASPALAAIQAAEVALKAAETAATPTIPAS